MSDVTEQPGQPRRPSLLVVAGPGRSGTSLVTGLVGRLGFHIPQPEIRANKSNPRGFGEPKWSLAFHKRLMESAGVNLSDGRPSAMKFATRASSGQRARAELADWLAGQFKVSPRVVIKDPRLLWFVKLYASVSEDLGADFGVITMLRHPAESIRSADMAYATLDVTTRAAGWINGALSVERSTRKMHRAFVQYDDLLSDWRKALGEAEPALSVGLTTPASDAQLSAADELVEPSLRRSHSDWADLAVPPMLQTMATRAFDSLSALAGSPDPDGVLVGEVDQIRADYVTTYRAAANMVRSSITAARADERRLVLSEIAAPPAKVSRARVAARKLGIGRLRTRLRPAAARLSSRFGR